MSVETCFHKASLLGDTVCTTENSKQSGSIQSCCSLYFTVLLRLFARY